MPNGVSVSKQYEVCGRPGIVQRNQVDLQIAWEPHEVMLHSESQQTIALGEQAGADD